MKSTHKLTDEQLANMIEEGFGRDCTTFDDMDSFEAYGVAEHAAELINREAFHTLDFSFAAPPMPCCETSDMYDDSFDNEEDDELNTDTGPDDSQTEK